jgi:hemerythrin
MTFFAWNADLSTGHEFIDDDHKKMIGLINALYSAIESKKDKEIIGKVLDNLIIYYRVHFKREENEMLRVNYPEYTEHEAEHEKFIQEVNQLKKSLDKGVPVSGTYVGKMLSDWLRNHIVKIDTKLAKVLASQKS